MTALRTTIAKTVASLPVPKGVKTPVPAYPAANGTTVNKLTAKSSTAAAPKSTATKGGTRSTR
ncbi:hypothetical protein ACFQ1I_07630 [Kitasatospora arboriphila]